MGPFSYTGLKIIQDQKIEDAMEHYRFSTGQETLERDPGQTFGAFLAHLFHFPARKPDVTTPFCDWEVEKTLS